MMPGVGRTSAPRGWTQTLPEALWRKKSCIANRIPHRESVPACHSRGIRKPACSYQLRHSPVLRSDLTRSISDWISAVDGASPEEERTLFRSFFSSAADFRRRISSARRAEIDSLCRRPLFTASEAMSSGKSNSRVTLIFTESPKHGKRTQASFGG